MIDENKVVEEIIRVIKSSWVVDWMQIHDNYYLDEGTVAKRILSEVKINGTPLSDIIKKYKSSTRRKRRRYLRN